MIDVPGGPFHDPVADAALIDAVRAHLAPHVEVIAQPVDVNHPSFGPAMADRLDALLGTGRAATTASVQ